MRSKTISLVLGSGGARGLAHVGVIRWLEEHGHEIRSDIGLFHWVAHWRRLCHREIGRRRGLDGKLHEEKRSIPCSTFPLLGILW